MVPHPCHEELSRRLRGSHQQLRASHGFESKIPHPSMSPDELLAHIMYSHLFKSRPDMAERLIFLLDTLVVGPAYHGQCTDTRLLKEACRIAKRHNTWVVTLLRHQLETFSRQSALTRWDPSSFNGRIITSTAPGRASTLAWLLILAAGLKIRLKRSRRKRNSDDMAFDESWSWIPFLQGRNESLTFNIFVLCVSKTSVVELVPREYSSCASIFTQAPLCQQSP